MQPPNTNRKVRARQRFRHVRGRGWIGPCFQVATVLRSARIGRTGWSPDQKGAYRPDDILTIIISYLSDLSRVLRQGNGVCPFFLVELNLVE